MCETKPVVVSKSLILLVAASFFINQAHTENKVGQHNKIKSQGPCENEYKKYCLNGGECYYLVDEDIVGCNCTWLPEGKRCEKYMWWDYVRLKIEKDENFLVENLTHCKIFNWKSDKTKKIYCKI